MFVIKRCNDGTYLIGSKWTDDVRRAQTWPTTHRAYGGYVAMGTHEDCEIIRATTAIDVDNTKRLR